MLLLIINTTISVLHAVESNGTLSHRYHIARPSPSFVILDLPSHTFAMLDQSCQLTLLLILQDTTWAENSCTGSMLNMDESTYSLLPTSAATILWQVPIQPQKEEPPMTQKSGERVVILEESCRSRRVSKKHILATGLVGEAWRPWASRDEGTPIWAPRIGGQDRLKLGFMMVSSLSLFLYAVTR